MRSAVSLGLAGLALVFATPARPQAAYIPPPHISDFPGLGTGRDPLQVQSSLELGPQLERGRSARWSLAEHRRLDQALATLQPHRKGVVDAYVVSIGLDSDPVFGREAREAGRVLSRRYDAARRTIVLAGTDGSAPSTLPNGSIEALTLALARIAELMDARQDVLVLYATTHGVPGGMVYHDADHGFGLLTPGRLAGLLDELGIRNRLLIISSCYSGAFLPRLASDTTIVATASAPDRTSFGCAAENDWTFFGDAIVNRALRKPEPLLYCLNEASALVGQWESERALVPSNPQVTFGAKAETWLAPLEARMPKEPSTPVGRPATADPPPTLVGR
jgi:hypothetical protein